MKKKLPEVPMKVQTAQRTGFILGDKSAMISKEDSSVINSKTKFVLCASLVLVALQCTVKKAVAQQSPSRLYGNVGLTTNYVDRGLTQSKKGPSINAGFGYWFGSTGRIGFEGASVGYTDENASVEMRLLTDYKFNFTPATDLKIRLDWVRYFSDSNRNKLIATLDQNIWGYHILASREDNFEGTKNPRNWFALHKDWAFTPSIQFNTTVGYSMPEGYNSYFDTRLAATYLMGSSFNVALVNTYVSSASQFGGRADTAFFLVLEARF